MEKMHPSIPSKDLFPNLDILRATNAKSRYFEGNQCIAGIHSMRGIGPASSQGQNRHFTKGVAGQLDR